MEDEATRTIECLSCGSEVKFAAGQVQRPCGVCEVEVPMPVRVGSNIPEHDMRSPLGDPDCSGRTVLRCGQCKAAVSGGSPPERCPFCRGRLVSRDDAAMLMWPDGVLPRLLSKEQARAKLREEQARLQLNDEVSELTAVYCPWWILSWEVEAPYTGQQGLMESYQDGSGTTRTRIVWSPWSGVVERPWTGVQRPGSIGLPTDAGRLSPWDYAFVQAYAPSMLADALCEHTTITPFEVMARHRVEIEQEVHQEVKHSIGGDRQIVESVDLRIKDEHYRLLLVPVWVGRTLTGEAVAVNARTGEVVLEGQAARQVTEDDRIEVPGGEASKIIWAAVVVSLVVGVLYWLSS